MTPWHSVRHLAVAAVACTAVVVTPSASSAAAIPSPGPQLARAASSAAPAAPAAPSSGRGLQLYDCDQAGEGGQCGTLDVPLDRAHPNRARLTLFFLHYPHRRPGPARSAIMLAGGGPGYSLTNTEYDAPTYVEAFRPLLGTRDLVIIDQRGVGNSGAIVCRALQRNPDYSLPGIIERTAKCAKQLGGRATMYGSGDVAKDMEAVRKALKVRKLDLFGGSYAAQDVQSYALRYPRRVRTAVLDAPVSISLLGTPGTPFDAFYTDGALELVDIIDRICARSGSCSAERARARDDLAWLTQRLRTTPVTGTANDLRGEPRALTVTENFLTWTILQSDDYNLTALSEVAAAAASLRAGDAVPLLRLGAEALSLAEGREPDPATRFSEGDNAARFCTDTSGRLAWDPAATPAQRLTQWQQAVAALPADRFGPFSKQAWLTRPSSPIAPDPCIAWPGAKKSTPAAVPPGKAFSARIPALIVTGDYDRSVPASNARALAARWPGSSYVEIPSAQHTAFFNSSDCAVPIMVRFIEKKGTGDTSCAARSASLYSYPAVGRFALTAADTRAPTVVAGDASTPQDRQVAVAATWAVTDSVRRAAELGQDGVGLRGGTFRFKYKDGEPKFTVPISGARFTTDVAVTGKAAYKYRPQRLQATVTVDGPGAEDGTLKIRGVWFGFGVETTVLKVTGTIGGRPVAVTLPAS